MGNSVLPGSIMIQPVKEDQEGKDLVSYGKLPSLGLSFFIFKMCSLDWINISQLLMYFKKQ